MNKFTGTKVFEFEQFGIGWRLGLTYEQAMKFLSEGATLKGV